MSAMSGLSTEVEGEGSVLQTEDLTAVSSKKAMRSYTREFLLSLSRLDVCTKLPEGFDASLLGEFDAASDSFQDRRVPGTSSVQGYKRSDYGSSVPGREDSSSYSRGLNRWDSRSSGRSNTDTDSESGRRYGSQPRRSWQSSEHDGLLGSGSFPRPPGFAAGTPVPRFHPNDSVHLKRSNEPYQPPRPYKAGPHSHRDFKDSFNDETFGSVDDASEDRVEEEKKRRAEFELMRKEQHKAFQDKQKSNQGKTEDPFSDLVLLDNPKDGKTSGDLDKISKQAAGDEFIKVSVPSHAPPSRPLVPPGFVSNVVDKSPTIKSIVHPEPLEMGKLDLEDSHQNLKSKAQAREFSSLRSMSGTSDIEAHITLDLPSVIQGVDHAKAPRHPDVSECDKNGKIIGIDFEVSGPKILGESVRSTSILDKLFGNFLTASNGINSNFVEDDPKEEDIWSTNTIGSKFSHWFPEEERKHPGNMTSENPNTLLTLITGGENVVSNVSDISPMGSIFTPEKVLGHNLSNLASSTTMISEKLSNSYVTEAKPPVMTCEDLEQSLLSEIEVSPNSRPAENEHHVLEVKVGHQGNSVDNQASHCLLSLLQKGSGSKDTPFSSVVEEQIPEKSIKQEVRESGSVKTVTLEALFGTAFMNELHSSQGNTNDSAKIDALGGTHFPPTMSGLGTNHLGSNAGISTLDKVGEWLGFNNAFQQVESSNHASVVHSKFNGIDGGIHVTLPEEDSLINLKIPSNAENPMLVSNSGSSNLDLLPSSSSIPIDVLDKLAALGGTSRDERSMIGEYNLQLLRGPSGVLNREFEFQNLHPQASSPQLHASQMNHSRPWFHDLDSRPTHLDPQLNFMPPDTFIHSDAPTGHQFPPNIGHPSYPHPGAGLPVFDRPMLPPLLQKMHMAGNLPPPHLGRGFPGVAPMAPHPSHNPTNYIQEPKSIHNFPFGQGQSYLGGPGLGQTGPELGVADNPPKAFQRLMEMELRANTKQMHPNPFATNGPSRAMYGCKLDASFEYR